MMALDTRAEKIVGVLHDVVEDCADKGFDWRFIESQGFSDEVIRGLRSVTIAPEEEASLKAATEADKIGIYMERVLHNLRPHAKDGYFCSQLGSKAQFIK